MTDARWNDYFLGVLVDDANGDPLYSFSPMVFHGEEEAVVLTRIAYVTTLEGLVTSKRPKRVWRVEDMTSLDGAVLIYEQEGAAW